MLVAAAPRVNFFCISVRVACVRRFRVDTSHVFVWMEIVYVYDMGLHLAFFVLFPPLYWKERAGAMPS